MGIPGAKRSRRNPFTLTTERSVNATPREEIDMVNQHRRIKGYREPTKAPPRTIPVRAPRPGRRPALRTTALDSALVTIPRTRVSQSGRAANSRRSGQGKDITHWRMGTRGSMWSTRWAAVSTIRRTPRGVQPGENADPALPSTDMSDNAALCNDEKSWKTIDRHT